MEWLNEFCDFSPMEESFYGFLSSLPTPHTPPTMPMPMEMPPPPPPMAMGMEMPTLPLPPPPQPFMAMGMEIPPPPPPNMAMPMETPTPMGVTKPQELWTNEENITFESLIREMEMLVTGNSSQEGVRMPATTSFKGKEKVVQEMGSPTSSNEPKKKKYGKRPDKGVPWTREEHKCFLMGIHKFGRGDWSNISKYYVVSKTPIQVASHAQKYYRRQNISTRRRRPSIHDINTVGPATAAASSSRFTSTCSAHSKYRLKYGVGAYVIEENRPIFMPPNAFNNNNSFFFPSLSNNQWG